MSFPINLTQLNEERLAADNLYFEGLITAIDAEIKNASDNELEPLFEFDTSGIIGNLVWKQQARIIGHVILHYRQNGIRAYVSTISTITNTPMTTPIKITIQWFLRDGQGYMKTYF